MFFNTQCSGCGCVIKKWNSNMIMQHRKEHMTNDIDDFISHSEYEIEKYYCGRCWKDISWNVEIAWDRRCDECRPVIKEL